MIIDEAEWHTENKDFSPVDVRETAWKSRPGSDGGSHIFSTEPIATEQGGNYIYFDLLLGNVSGGAIIIYQGHCSR
jgi:hypothetical protein